MQENIINVSELSPPEPMTMILQALSTLEHNHYLKVIHRREPFPLYEKLVQTGWDYLCLQKAQEEFHLYIYRISDQALFEKEKRSLTTGYQP